ncbi:Histone-lysine N-methyltransferase ASHR3 [Citrus sinensis]|uniref:Histone-lysine N-methyltransferase ASHR3 n=1 Tax=Citrus sinensis TaxID=2711 RepID=A0ACB8P8V0_CITSI|nr:Histone-lysine N-methyltransferase ASHR3 [Citrus sinensis]
MPDLANLALSSSSSSLTLTRCASSLKPLAPPHSATESPGSDSAVVKTLALTGEEENVCANGNGHSVRVMKRCRGAKNISGLEDHVAAWVKKKMELGVPQSNCSLPFLVGAKKMIECRACHRFIYHGEEACFICRQRLQWRCVRCTIASHDKCAPWPDRVIHLKDQPGRAVCWRHPAKWLLDKQEVFCRLPLPYADEEFKIDLTWKDLMENKVGPPPSECSENCVCRVQYISCSKACHCSETCNNRPFRKEKKIKIVKTEFCGWGVEAAEPINKGEFIIEYIGEVIDDALCEQRLWDMKYRGVQNFYMCEIRKDFTIDATFKGNFSRFLNHSCDPNCFLEKWQVEGETRVGVFAARSIKAGEPLTYDYRFVQFGPEVKCYCGASSCQGYLGTKRKIVYSQTPVMSNI